MTEQTQTTEDTNDSAERVETVASFDRIVTEERRVLADFYADWCGPCQLIAPAVEELAAETDAAVVKVNVEELPDLALRYDVKSVPTFLVFDDGSVAERLVGMHEKKRLAAAVE